jgi:hypothetical protein
MAAPARAASIAASAIWRGVTGTLLERAVVSPAPVTAQVMKTLRLGCRAMVILSLSGRWAGQDDAGIAESCST